jgi:hypothetical protein
MMHHHESIVAYTRVYEERQAGTWHIGRVVVRKDWRLKGLGKKIMNQSINFLFTKQDVELILISAQEYLLKFYSDFGFEAFGEAYLEDGIPHRAMKLDKKKNRSRITTAETLIHEIVLKGYRFVKSDTRSFSFIFITGITHAYQHLVTIFGVIYFKMFHFYLAATILAFLYLNAQLFTFLNLNRVATFTIRQNGTNKFITLVDINYRIGNCIARFINYRAFNMYDLFLSVFVFGISRENRRYGEHKCKDQY